MAAAGVDERAALGVDVVPGRALSAPFLRVGDLLGPVALPRRASWWPRG